MSHRIGHGYDIHRTAADRPLVLGGVRFEAGFGLEGHSDADPVTHAICDAFLGAAGLPDIGTFFPNTDSRWSGVDSQVLLRRVVQVLREAGWQPVNIDATVIAEKPRVAGRILDMKAALSASTGLPSDAIGIKATTNEGVGDIGRGLAIAAHAVALIARGMRAFAAAAAVCLAGVLVGGCSRATNVAEGDRSQVLHRGINPEPPDLDPHMAAETSYYTVLSALLEGLVAEDPMDLHPVPGVAERWEVSPDGLTYTFYLRREARWSNGDPVVAGDFVASWRRILTPSLGAADASQLFIIQGAEAFNKGDGDFSQVGVRARDEHTLSVVLEHPAGWFLSVLSSPAFLPVHIPTIERYGSVAQRGNPWAEPGRWVGNGPFDLKSWHHGQEIVVVRSRTYWDAASVRLAEIHFHVFDSIDAEERAFRSGQLHVTEFVPTERIETYRTDAPQLLRTDPLLGTYFVRVNVRRPGLNDARVRLALALAVDRQAIAGKVLRGGETPAPSFTPPGMGAYSSEMVQVHSLDTARRLLSEAGYAGGQGLPTFVLLYNNSESHRVVAEALQEMWRRDLGVSVRLENQEMKGVEQARATGSYDLLQSSWIADYAEPSAFLNLMRSDNGNNFTGWSDPDYDEILFAAARETSAPARNALYSRAERLLLREAPVIPLYHYVHAFLIRPSVRNWYPTVLDHHPYKTVFLQP